jgi:Domain of unknown function (DUF4126)
MSVALFLAAGRILGAALACGLNLYATVALVGFASRLGIVELPPGLNGLEQWLLIGGALALFFVEFISAAIPWVDSSWEAIHTIVRPIGAAALTFVALEAAPLPLRIAGVVLAATAALASHMAKVGLRLVVTRRRSTRLIISAAEDIAAGALVIGALVVPTVALAVVGLFVALLVLTGPGLWRAALFASRSVIALLRGFFGPRGWRPVREVPRTMRERVPPTEVGQADARLARATLDCTATGPWRNGWLVLSGREARFLHSRMFRPVEIRIPRPDDATVRNGVIADILILRRGDARYMLHILKDGPPADVIVGAMQLVIE